MVIASLSNIAFTLSMINPLMARTAIWRIDGMTHVAILR